MRIWSVPITVILDIENNFFVKIKFFWNFLKFWDFWNFLKYWNFWMMFPNPEIEIFPGKSNYFEHFAFSGDKWKNSLSSGLILLYHFYSYLVISHHFEHFSFLGESENIVKAPAKFCHIISLNHIILRIFHFQVKNEKIIEAPA